MDNWDWDIQNRAVSDVREWKRKYPVVQEYTVSNDGERIAAVVESGPKKVTVCINGTPWESEYEKIWSLKFSPDSHPL